jgi:hypothetical protein
MPIRLVPTFGALFSCLLFSASFALAEPPIWESNYGAVIPSLTLGDDESDSVTLSFDFPFDGVLYRTIFIGTNGDLQLGSLGIDDDIDYDHWSYMEEFTADGAPSISGFATDLDLSSTGTIHFNDFGDRAVFTWNEVGTDSNELALSTFQISLYSNGRILLGWNGILDGAGEDLLLDLGEGIVVGITAGDIPQPTNPEPIDLSVPTVGGTTMFGRWCYDVADSCGVNGNDLGLTGPVNTAFDLDNTNVDFMPVAGGFSIGGAEAGNPRLRCEDDSTTGGCRRGYQPTASVDRALTEFTYRIEAGAVSGGGANDFDQQLILSPPGTNVTLEWSAFIGQLGVRIFADGGETQFFVPGFLWMDGTDYRVEIETDAATDTYSISIDGQLLVDESLGADFTTLDRMTFRSAFPTTGAFHIDDVAISPLLGGAAVLLDTFDDEIVGSTPVAPDIGNYSGEALGVQTVISIPEPGSAVSVLAALSTVAALAWIRRSKAGSV